MLKNNSPIKGRGTAMNPDNRFESVRFEIDQDFEESQLFEEEETSQSSTQFFKDNSRSILSTNNSPDVGFEVSLNPYRGCEHGCIYCYARPTHEYLGFSAGLDFESKILVKEQAPHLLRQALSKKTWVPKVINLSGVTDCYQQIERRLKLTRQCLEVLAEFRNPVILITKSALVTRDLDFLSNLREFKAVAVFISITTLNEDLRKGLEPRTSSIQSRLQAIELLAKHQIPVGVMVAPVIPAINEFEIPTILQAAATAGAQFAGHVILRLPWGLKDLFEDWLGIHFADRKEKVLNRLRAIRGGRLNSTEFGKRMSGEGIFAQEIHQLFSIAKRKAGFEKGFPELSTEFFKRPHAMDQLSLF